MRDSFWGRFGAWIKMIAWSAVFGVLAMTFLTPAIAVTSVGATTAITVFENLPNYIKPTNGSDASTIYAMQNGKPVEVATFYEENRKSIPFDQMSVNIINAVIATEDPRFYEHGGVDWISFIRATATNALQGGGGPGGSTITMQYVKNSLVEAAVLSGDKEAAEAATTASGIDGVMRKLREIRMAIALEQQTSKKDIIAGYLNLSFFGGQIYGIEQASKYYFGKSAKDVDVSQAAILAAMLQSPNLYRPDVAENLPGLKDRRNYVLKNMKDSGYITQEQFDAATAEEITVVAESEPAGCEATQMAAFFCDYVVWTIRNSPEFGADPGTREQLLRRGGLDIYTTLDLSLQKVAYKTVNKWVPSKSSTKLGAASVSVQVGTGRILSLAVNRYFDQTDRAKKLRGHTSVNYATDKDFGGSSGFQTGSTYKVFTLAQWLKSGKGLSDHVDSRVRTWKPADFTAAACGGLGGGNWKPKNSHSAPDDVNILTATSQSINTAYANMASQLDLCDIRNTAMDFGVHRADGQELAYVPSSVLGTNELSPLTMAAAFAAIANKGQYCTPVAIDRLVVRSSQEELLVPETQCNQAVSPEIAAAMTYALEGVIRGGTGGASNPGDGVPLAGKTGTTDDSVQTWMCGYTTKVSTSVWVGNVSGSQSLNKMSLKGQTASTVRHQIFKSIMTRANKLYKGGKFPSADGKYTGATMVRVPALAGLLPAEAVKALKDADLNSELVARHVSSLQPEGTVAYTRKAQGTKVPRGTLIKIYISKGGMFTVPEVRGMSVADAIQALVDAGFDSASGPVESQTQFYAYDPDIPAGRVLRSDPIAGTKVQLGGAALLYISLGPQG